MYWDHILRGDGGNKGEDYNAEEVADEFRRNGITLEIDAMDQLAQSCHTRIQSRRQTETDIELQQKLESVRQREITKSTQQHKLGKKRQVCVFCKNNKEREEVYSTHMLKDSSGRTVCPILYWYTCPVCGATGDRAHTKKYCPYYDGLSVVNMLLQTPRNCAGKHRK